MIWSGKSRSRCFNTCSNEREVKTLLGATELCNQFVFGKCYQSWFLTKVVHIRAELVIYIDGHEKYPSNHHDKPAKKIEQEFSYVNRTRLLRLNSISHYLIQFPKCYKEYEPNLQFIECLLTFMKDLTGRAIRLAIW
eukprot:NODE_479_length_7889_cov_0.324390.p3 type:complete len:137 gc:universal NODE_479_length_7889_cov_0.324390:5834-5424(-)